jgi:hypothetical protein
MISLADTQPSRPERRLEADMNVQEIKTIARKHGIKTGTLKKADLVRAIQSTEGNEACFDSGRATTCGQERCLWKEDCK